MNQATVFFVSTLKGPRYQMKERYKLKKKKKKKKKAAALRFSFHYWPSSKGWQFPERLYPCYRLEQYHA